MKDNLKNKNSYKNYPRINNKIYLIMKNLFQLQYIYGQDILQSR